MIHKIVFKNDYREIFKKGEEILFRPGVNLIVGEQGTGKSSLIKALVELSRGGFQEIIEIYAEPSAVRSIDFEKSNPRTTTPDPNKLTVEDLLVHFQSHGQVQKAIIRGMQPQEHTVFLMDEPDMALSPRSCHWLSKTFLEHGKNHQIIAAVHNPIIIASVKEVLSLEHKKWMKSKDFLKSHET